MSREMKHSGIEWIGDIPKEWKLGRYKYFGRFTKGKLPSNTNDEQQGVPIIGASEMLGKQCRTYTVDTNVPMCSPNDILILWDGANAGIVANGCEGVLSSTAVVYSCSDKRFNEQFLFYLLKNGEPFFKSKVNGTTIPHMNSKYLDDYVCLLPPLPEQQKIADYLDKVCGEIDGLVALQEAMIDELKAYKQSVITEAVTRGLNPNVPLKPSGIDWIGEIPEHWEVTKIKHCLLQDKNNLRVGPFGSALSSNDFKSEGYWVYNQRCVLDNNFTSNDTFVDEIKYNELKGFEVLPGDILITTRGSIGKIAIVPNNAPKGILHPCIIRFVINDSIIDISLLKHIFNESDFVLRQMRYQSNSTTIDVLYSYALKNLVLTLPPLQEQHSIASYLDEKCSEIDSLITIKQQKIEELKDYKISIIYEYVTGKKEVV